MFSGVKRKIHRGGSSVRGPINEIFAKESKTRLAYIVSRISIIELCELSLRDLIDTAKRDWSLLDFLQVDWLVRRNNMI